jgi:hypothetical protein
VSSGFVDRGLDSTGYEKTEIHGREEPNMMKIQFQFVGIAFIIPAAKEGRCPG